MVTHIVLWRLKDEANGASKAENLAAMKAKLESLVGLIPEIVHLEVGVNFDTSDGASDLCLYSKFKNKADLEIYQKHPEHQKVVAFGKTVVSERRVADYEF